MFYRITLSICLVVLLATTTWAGIQPRAFSLSPMIGGHIFEDGQNFDDADFLSIALGYNLTDRATLEAVYSQADVDGETAADSDATVRTFRLDALYHFMPENKLIPYLAVGLGVIDTNPEIGQNREHLLANVGGGVKYFLTSAIALRADVRYLLDFPEPENNLLYSAGLLFQFGAPAPAAAPIILEQPPTPVATPAVPQPVDSDGDGVFDSLDQCPATVQGTPVDSLGCPLDSDGDGVFDNKDQCLNTPKGAPVNSIGCALDSDGDGVFDYLDKCLSTPRGVSVDANGCPTKLTLRINFGLDSDKIGPAYDGEIAKAAQCINDFPGNIVYIDGHTDNRGPDTYNQQLSERRATAVKNRLTEKFNIPATRMTARGFGESMPVADNATEDGYFQNRRVEVACGATE